MDANSLIPPQAFQQLTDLKTKMDAIVASIDQATASLIKFNAQSGNINKGGGGGATSAKTDTGEMQKVNALQREYLRLQKDIAAQEAKLIALQSEEAKRLAEVAEQTKKLKQENTLLAKEQLAAVGSVDKMTASYARLSKEFNRLSEAERNSPLGIAKAEDLSKLRGEIDKIKTSTGQASSGFNTLSYNLQQIFREVPSAQSLNQFFLAISNNVPMFTDSLKKATAEYNALKAAGENAVPVWKQILSSIFSWQTALIVALQLLVMYGKEISKFVKDLMGVKDAQEQVNDAVKKSTANINSEILVLDSLWKKYTSATKGTDEFKRAKDALISQYGEYLKGIDLENLSIEQQTKLYKELTNNVLEAAKAKALQAQTEEKAKEFGETQAKNLDKIKAKLQQIYGKGYGAAYFDQISKDIAQTGEVSKYWRDFLIKEANKQQKSLDQTVKKGAINQIFTLFGKLSDNKKEFEEVTTGISKGLDAIFGKTTVRDQGIIETLNKEIATLKVKRDQAKTQADILAITAEIVAKQNELAKYDIPTTKKLQKDARQKINNELREEYELKYALASVDKVTASNEKVAYQERLKALESYKKYTKEGLEKEQQYELSQLNLTENAKTKIKAKYVAINKELDNSYDKERESIVEQNSKREIKIITDTYKERLAILDSGQKEEELKTAQAYAKGEITTEEYNRRILGITTDGARARMEIELESLQSILDTQELTDEQRAELSKRLAEAQAQYSNYIADLEIENEKKIAAQKLEAKIKLIQIEKELADKRKEIQKEAFNFAKQLSDAAFENSINNIQKERDALEEAEQSKLDIIQKQLDSGAINKEQAAAREQAVKDQAQQKDEELSKKQGDLKVKQAKFDKAFEIFKIGVETIQAVTSIKLTASKLAAAAHFNPLLTPLIPLVLAQIPIAIASGAIQAAAVAARPLPKYAQGTKDHPGGLAVTGDAFRHELVQLPGGRFIKTPNVPTIMDLPAHSIVYPNYEKAMLNLTNQVAGSIVIIDDRKQTIAINTMTDKLLQSQERTNRILKSLGTGRDINAFKLRY